MRKKILALLLACMIGITALPQPAFADGEEEEYWEKDPEEYEIIPPDPASEDDSGSFNGWDWTFDHVTQTLTITGTGILEVKDSWSRPDYPWYENHQFEVAHIIVSEGFTGLGRGAFGMYGIRAYDISLPSTLKTIGGSALAGLNNVEEIVIPEGVTEIGGAAFSNCDHLRRLVLPDSLTTINGRNLCTHSPRLTEVKLSENLKILPRNSFYYCENLETVHFSDSIEEIQLRCFAGCSSLKIDRLPENLVTVRREAFEDCIFSEDLTLPPHLDEIEERGFPREWVKTQKMILTSTGFLYSYQSNFGGVNEWENVVLPDTVKTIGPYAFCGGTLPQNADDCAYFDQVTIPRSVTDIRPDAFSGCNMSGIIGYTGSYAQQYAQGNGIPFTALDEPENTVAPQFGARTLSIENTSEMLGTGYPMTDWHTLILREKNGNNPLQIKDADTGWEGSCYGLAVLQILLDSGTLSPALFGAETIPEIAPTADNISFINCLHHVSNIPAMIGEISGQTKDTQKQALARMIIFAQNVNAGAAPFLLIFRTQNGLHAVTGYGLESGGWTWDGQQYTHRILLWDSNYIKSSEKDHIYYNSKTMHWCIPAYGLSYAKSEDDAGALLYALDNVPELFSYFAERVHPLPGDVTADAQLSIADAVLMSRYLAEDSAVSKATGRYNLDADGDGFTDADDILYILRNLSA